ncbi:DNA-binding protein [Mesorhizobium sp. M8A.F.Ca.ET.202.01.1.1]|nr:DNA-binding protein [Mesorhizobium sp. M8A.F.Ca.ET.202.01.1.1]TGR24580.1 DNA-binding protein [Mesorhizobium sp. M8A.F.Ca.ET.197.01.1.1]TGR39970.1 DNA-binding protein [bacterium M00.F.Ca.ET.199.01.1.1]TGR48401.1 DNA-binding protein [Mesorhizobium sp. M8A.F.Ca.ET.198.01.1.1]TGU24174.1 DNA-binding protein [bacterium M00.F.Ca.ET.156.01.1.1]TGV89390.1 DNA-binding protein [Mesorhizobium sp. M00.F.Ca.ET.149.01.1.1]
MTKWITTTQLAKELQVSDRTIRYWARSGEIPAHRLGRQLRFHWDEIDAWLSSKKISRPEVFRPPAEPQPQRTIGRGKDISGHGLEAAVLRLLEKRRQRAEKEANGKR